MKLTSTCSIVHRKSPAKRALPHLWGGCSSGCSHCKKFLSCMNMKALFPSRILFLSLNLAHFAAAVGQHNTYAATMHCFGYRITRKAFKISVVLSKGSCPLSPLQLTAVHTPDAYTSLCSTFLDENISIKDIFHHIEVYCQRQLQRQSGEVALS